jgi:hypothetical protein
VAADIPIDWGDICRNPDDYETLVKLLLVRLYPNGEVIDGRGGDGGREFQVRSTGRHELYEAKSFTGRVSKGRRRQVERSLVSAAQHQPDAWHLVVPIDHNTSELAWFDSLRAGDFPFVARWNGQSWLESQLLQHEDLKRYAQGDTLLRWVRHYKIETEALAGGVPDLAKRAAALQKLANEVDPHWRPVMGTLPDGTPAITVEAKHPEAASRSPITFRVGVAVPNDPEHLAELAKIRTGLALGTGARIPGEFISEFQISAPAALGLSTHRPGMIEFISIPTTAISEIPTQTVSVYEPGAAWPVASQIFHPKERTAGFGGSRIIAYNETGTVRLTTEVHQDVLKIHLTALDVDNISPGALLPGLRLCMALKPPNSLVLRVERDGQSFTDRVEIEGALLSEMPDDRLLPLVEDLAYIQDRLNQPFPVPVTVTDVTVSTARRLRLLLEGKSVRWWRGPLRVTLDPSRVEEFRNEVSQFATGDLRITYDDMEVLIDERSVHTGPVSLTGTVAIDLNAIDLTDAERPRVSFEVLGDGWFHAHLGVPDDQVPDVEDRPPGAGRVEIRPLPVRDSGG